MGIEAIATLAGLILPPAVDLFKKLFVKSDKDSPEATMSSLATTKPEVLPQYVEALAKLKDTERAWFNRDVVGEVSKWIADLRAVIRPATVIVSLMLISLWSAGVLPHLNEETRASLLFIISTWVGGRITIGRG